LNNDVEPFIGEHALLDSEIRHSLVAGRQPIDQERDSFSSEPRRAGTNRDDQKSQKGENTPHHHANLRFSAFPGSKTCAMAPQHQPL
jgi:hypothetical protein